MLSTTIISALIGAASLVSASPLANTKRQAAQAITDVTILQYATVLEDLEAFYYAEYLGQYDNAAFAAAGYPDWVRGRVSQIASHEAQHAGFLRTALGSAAPPKCTYKFPVTDVDSFLATAAVIESVGVSAYLGAAALIESDAYLTIAGSILTTEARHQGWLNSAVEKAGAWSGPEDTPLGFSPVFTIASAFITGCDSAITLPFTAFPALTYDAGASTVSYPGMADGQYIAVLQGLDVATFPVTGGKVTLPTLQGFGYLLAVSTANTTEINDSTTLAGPVIINNSFNSQVANPAPAF